MLREHRTGPPRRHPVGAERGGDAPLDRDLPGTGRTADAKIAAIAQEYFDLRPKGIIAMLKLLRTIYRKTAAYCHFGRDEPEVSLEATDKARALRSAAGL